MTNEAEDAGRLAFRQALEEPLRERSEGRVKKVCAASLFVLGTHDIIASVMQNVQFMRLCPSTSLIFELTQRMP